MVRAIQQWLKQICMAGGVSRSADRQNSFGPRSKPTGRQMNLRLADARGLAPYQQGEAVLFIDQDADVSTEF
jgi:hypothetical protein